MNIKKSMIAGVMTLLVVFTFTTAAWAGSAHHHRMEGLAWGIGAAILGKVILDHHRNTYPQPAPAPQPVVIQNHYHQPPAETAGHWEVQREWVPPQYEKVWNPGHYNRKGRWIRGHWMRVESEPGYWREKEVWVPHY